MPFYDPKERPEKQIITGVRARPVCGKNLMLAVVDLDANAVLPAHSHPHEQGGIVLHGELEFDIAGETKILHPGDLYIIPGGVEHSVKVGPDPAQVLDIFSPVREEWMD